MKIKKGVVTGGKCPACRWESVELFQQQGKVRRTTEDGVCAHCLLTEQAEPVQPGVYTLAGVTFVAVEDDEEQKCAGCWWDWRTLYRVADDNGDATGDAGYCASCFVRAYLVTDEMNGEVVS